jgi:hypothetical protein
LYFICYTKKYTLIKTFVKAQCENPVGCNWVTKVRKVISDLQIIFSFLEIKTSEKVNFTNSFKKNNKSYIYLIIKSNYIKGKINYGDKLQMQLYLMPNNVLTFEEQKDIFSYRSRMNQINDNFRGNKKVTICICGETLLNKHILSCKRLNDEISHTESYNN